MKTEIKDIKRKKLPALIEKLVLKGARPVSVVLKTDKELLKKSRVSGKENTVGDIVVKIAEYSGMLNFEYQKSVNAERVREGKKPNFKAKANWFTHSNPVARPLLCLPGGPCGYIQLKIQRRGFEKYFDEEGNQIPKNRIKNLLPKQNIAAVKARQGVEKPILTITPKLESFLCITCDGITYNVI